MADELQPEDLDLMAHADESSEEPPLPDQIDVGGSDELPGESQEMALSGAEAAPVAPLEPVGLDTQPETERPSARALAPPDADSLEAPGGESPRVEPVEVLEVPSALMDEVSSTEVAGVGSVDVDVSSMEYANPPQAGVTLPGFAVSDSPESVAAPAVKPPPEPDRRTARKQELKRRQQSRIQTRQADGPQAQALAMLEREARASVGKPVIPDYSESIGDSPFTMPQVSDEPAPEEIAGDGPGTAESSEPSQAQAPGMDVRGDPQAPAVASHDAGDVAQGPVANVPVPMPGGDLGTSPDLGELVNQAKQILQIMRNIEGKIEDITAEWA